MRGATAGHYQNKDKFFVHVLSKEHTEGILAQSPVGHSILRVDVDESGKSLLIVSYKYAEFIFNCTIPSITMKVPTGGNKKCKTNPKNYKFLRKLATDYLPRLQLFINMIVNNHNFIERELLDNEIESELMYRKFLIFPLDDRVYLKRKTEAGIQSACISFDFEELTFNAEHDKIVTPVETFNEFLITDFLQIDFRDKLQVQYALGHQTRATSNDGSSDTLDELDLRCDIEILEIPHGKTHLKAKEKERLVETLKEARNIRSTENSHTVDIRHVLANILESVLQDYHSLDRKMEWIHKGIIDQLFPLVLTCNGNAGKMTTPLKIIKILLRNNEEGCIIFVKRCIGALDSNFEWSCIGNYSCIFLLMKEKQFRETFLKLLGVPKLYGVYVRASFLLLRELKQNATAMGEIFALPSDTYSISPRSDIDAFSDVDKYISSDSESEEEIVESTKPGPTIKSGRLAIPKLNIPTKKSQGPRKRDKTEDEFKRSASDELMALAKNLGETYMTQDLTVLSVFLQNDSGVADRKKKRLSLSISTTYNGSVVMKGQASSSSSTDEVAHSDLKDSCYYRIKCVVLKTIARLTIYWKYFEFVQNPVNLLFSELLHCHKDNLFTNDSDFRKLIYSVLANYANHVEYIHCYQWEKLTKGFSVNRTKGFRQKADKFIWRIYNQLAPAVDVKEFADIELYLTLLSEYMTFCPTGIVSMQVANVCMELLLRVKDLVITRGQVTPTNKDHLPLIYCLIDVIDQIALQNDLSPLREVLVSLFIEKKETWRFIKNTSCQVLLGQGLEQSVLSSNPIDGQKKMNHWRSQSIEHFKVCFELLKAQITFYQSEEKKQVPFAKEARQNVQNYLYHFEFLIHPNRGYLLQILGSETGGKTSHPWLEKEILQLLISIFSWKDCVFLKDKAYIDAYVTYAYLSFIKLYHCIDRDKENLELIQLHLELLLAFAQHKNDKIIMKFYQLRVMDFLVREINLEYDITLRNKTNKPQSSRENDCAEDLPEALQPEKIDVPAVTTTLPEPEPEKVKLRGAGSTVKHFFSFKSRKKNRTYKAESINNQDTLSDKLESPTQVKPSPGTLPEHKQCDALEEEGEESEKELEESEEEELEEESEEYEEGEESEYAEEEEEEEEEEESEYEDDTEEDEEEEFIKKKPAIPSLSGVPIKGKKTPGIGGMSLALPADVIKGGKGSIPSLTHPSNDSIGSNSDTLYADKGKVGILSQLENEVNKEDPKWQLIFMEKKKKEQAENEEELTQKDLQEMNKLYRKERKERKLYGDTGIHITCIQLIFSLLLTPWETLEPLYSDQFPLDNQKLNIPFLLRTHLGHVDNSLLIPPLVAGTQKMGRAPFRLLKLLCTELFRKEDYTDLKRLAVGAYGTVYRCRLKPEHQASTVAIKLMSIPKTIHDRCVVHDIFDEVLVLDKFKEDHRISHTYDFGTDDDYYWITMKKYKCSLKHWRKQQKGSLQQNLALYLNIYMNVLNSFQFLTEKKVNHFDIKCDNFLIQPLNEENWTVQDEESFWNPVSDVPNFSVCLADFGEAKVFEKEIDGYTTRNRGTEFTKSPEMLLVAYASQKTRENYDRRKQVGASSPSDIWSLGCLLYELLTGEFLFYDTDCCRFYIRLSQSGQELFTPEKIEKIGNSEIVDFLRFVLNRDPVRRPSIHDVIQRFKYVRGRLTSTGTSSKTLRFPTPRGQERKKSAAVISPLVAVAPVTVTEPTSNVSTLPTIVQPNTPITSSGSISPSPSPSLSTITQIGPEISTEQFNNEKKCIKNRPGMEYFSENISQVTDYLFIGPAYEARKREILKNLRITHMVNCTDMESLYSTEFFTCDLNLPKDSDKLSTCMETIVSFINEARMSNGKVLVYSEDATSRAPSVVIAYLMFTRNWNYFEAMIFVKDCRYIIDPNEALVKVLCNAYRQKQRSCRQQFQCICGACCITISDPFIQTEFANPFPCSCTLEEEPSNCPNIGCSAYIEEIQRLFQFGKKEIRWGYTNRNNVIGDLATVTRPYDQMKELCIRESNIVTKPWTVYKCRTCDFITHALRKDNAPADDINPRFDMAIVTSVAVA